MRRLHSTSGTMRKVAAAIIGIAMCGLLRSSPAAADETADEIRLGAQIAKEIESRYRVVTDPAMVDRLARVSEALVPVVDRQDLTYHFRVIDIPGVNALGVPGGWVYVTRGMMKFVRSDHELAAVLAHELTHVAHRHYYIQQARQNRMVPALIIATALSVLARSAAPIVGISLATQGAMANYQRDLEKEADLTGISYLTKTSYSPVAMLTLMEHLDQADKLTGRPDLGPLYQDHPLPDERVGYIRDDLVARGIPLVRRIAEGYLKITLDPPNGSYGQPVTVLVDGRPIIRLGAVVAGEDPSRRARALAARLNVFFNTDPAPYDVRDVISPGRWTVIGGQTQLFEVTPEDAAYANGSPTAVAEGLRARLAEALAEAPYYRKF